MRPFGTADSRVRVSPGSNPRTVSRRLGLLRWYWEGRGALGNPEQNAIGRETARRILAALTPPSREILYLTIGCGYAASEVAQRQKCPARTVRHRARMARAELGLI